MEGGGGGLCEWTVIRSILAILQWWGFNVTVIIMNKWIFQVCFLFLCLCLRLLVSWIFCFVVNLSVVFMIKVLVLKENNGLVIRLIVYWIIIVLKLLCSSNYKIWNYFLIFYLKLEAIHNVLLSVYFLTNWLNCWEALRLSVYLSN